MPDLFLPARNFFKISLCLPCMLYTGLTFAQLHTRACINKDETPLLKVGDLHNTPNPKFKYGISIARQITKIDPADGFYGVYSSQAHKSPTPAHFLCGGHFEAIGATPVENLEGIAGIARIETNSESVEVPGNLRALYAGIATKGKGTKKIDSGNSTAGNSYTIHVKKTDATTRQVIIKTTAGNALVGRTHATIAKTYGTN